MAPTGVCQPSRGALKVHCLASQQGFHSGDTGAHLRQRGRLASDRTGRGIPGTNDELEAPGASSSTVCIAPASTEAWRVKGFVTAGNRSDATLGRCQTYGHIGISAQQLTIENTRPIKASSFDILNEADKGWHRCRARNPQRNTHRCCHRNLP